MAFKRTNAKSLVNTYAKKFSQVYKFSNKANFSEAGRDAYVLFLGLESGYYETPCHMVRTHRVDNKTIGFNNSTFNTYIKCKGIDESGNRNESLCCTLAKMEKDRIPDKGDSGKRIISTTSFRVHIPVLILSNSLNDSKKHSYPVSKVSVLNSLRSEEGLNFSYLDMASSSFKDGIIKTYGNKLKEDGIIDYELNEESEEFMDEVLKRLPNTLIKIRGISKVGFERPLKEYSFFPFDNPAIASESPEGEREAIVHYRDNQEIQNKICEFLDLFNVEVDNLLTDWTEKDLQEYYNSALGVSLNSPVKEAKKEVVEEEIEIIKTPATAKETEEEITEDVSVTSTPKTTKVKKEVPKEEEEESEVKLNPPASDEDLEELLNGSVSTKEEKPETDEDLEEFSYDSEEEDEFFTE